MNPKFKKLYIYMIYKHERCKMYNTEFYISKHFDRTITQIHAAATTTLYDCFNHIYQVCYCYRFEKTKKKKISQRLNSNCTYYIIITLLAIYFSFIIIIFFERKHVTLRAYALCPFYAHVAKGCLVPLNRCLMNMADVRRRGMCGNNTGLGGGCRPIAGATVANGPTTAAVA